MKLFELKIAKAWSSRTARKNPEPGFIDEVHGLPLGMALWRLLVGIQVPETGSVLWTIYCVVLCYPHW